MQKYNRYPIPEVLVSVPADYKLFIDSIITHAYREEELNEWTDYKPDINAPENSLGS